MQMAQGCEDPMRQGRLEKSYGIIRSSVSLELSLGPFPVQYFTLTWEMSALTKSISEGGLKPPSPPVHVHPLHVDFPILTFRSMLHGPHLHHPRPSIVS
jgi:hypothetical protein